MDVENLKSHLFICEYPSPKWNTSPQTSNGWKTWLLSWEFPSEGTKVKRLMQKCSRLGLGPWGIPSHRVLSLVWPEGRQHSNSPTLSATLSSSLAAPGALFRWNPVRCSLKTPCYSFSHRARPTIFFQSSQCIVRFLLIAIPLRLHASSKCFLNLRYSSLSLIHRQISICGRPMSLLTVESTGHVNAVPVSWINMIQTVTGYYKSQFFGAKPV